VSDYDPQNIFGRILRGEIPSAKVYENDHLLMIMDAFPQSKGHTLVLPKAGSRNILDADPATVAKVAADLPKLARAVKSAMKADGLRVMQFNEAPSGQTVFHLHFHLIPVYEGIELGRHAGGKQADAAELAAQANAISAAIA
jgi:histidine triad (HIT) family protein